MTLLLHCQNRQTCARLGQRGLRIDFVPVPDP